MAQNRTTYGMLALFHDVDYAWLRYRATNVELMRPDLAHAGDGILLLVSVVRLVSVIAADDDSKEAEAGVIVLDGVVNSGIAFADLVNPMRVLVQIAKRRCRWARALCMRLPQ